MVEQFKAWAMTGPGMGILGLVAIGLYILWSNRDALKEYVAARITTDTTDTVDSEIPSRRAVLDYLDACYAYFKDVNCPEGMKAISTAVEHAFHDDEKAVVPPATTVTDLANAITDALKKPVVVDDPSPAVK